MKDLISWISILVLAWGLWTVAKAETPRIDLRPRYQPGQTLGSSKTEGFASELKSRKTSGPKSKNSAPQWPSAAQTPGLRPRYGEFTSDPAAAGYPTDAWGRPHSDRARSGR